jgi:hypothetical protein
MLTREKPGDSTYSIDILYAYTVSGREYRSNQYDFVGGSSNDRTEEEGIVGRYQPGMKDICYINPQDPTDAVLQRQFTTSMLVGLIPAVFFFVGVGGLAAVSRDYWLWRSQPVPVA